MGEIREVWDPETMEIERKKWIISFEETSQRRSVVAPPPNLSIYCVTSSLAVLKKGAYTPSTVSLGPYRSGKPMDPEKDRALDSFFSQTSGVSFRRLVEAVASVEEELKDYYETPVKRWREVNWFLKMMITDGFFVLAVLCFLGFKNPFFRQHRVDIIEELALRFGQQWASKFIAQIRRDMLLLENQLPILLLQTLMKALGGEAKHVNILILVFLDLELKPPLESDDEFFGFHILDVYWRRKVSQNYSLRENHSMCWSATDLVMAGVRFRKNNSNYLNDISFSHGTFQLPRIDIDDTTEILLLNLMAFEQFRHVGTNAGVTYYVYFMRGLISSSMDVTLLRYNDIINSCDLSDNDVIKLFKQISEGVFIGLDSYVDEKLDRYLKSWWHIQRAKFAHTCFFILPAFLKTHWAILILFGGFFYFITNILQTLYTIFAFYSHNK